MPENEHFLTLNIEFARTVLAKPLICNFSKGKIGEDACTLLGSMLVTTIQLSALYRAKQPEHLRVPFFLYIDECQTFATQSFVDMLSEARKYGLGVFMANQFLDQLHEKIRSAILGNCGTLISFRVGATDAEILAKEFYPVFVFRKDSPCEIRELNL